MRHLIDQLLDGTGYTFTGEREDGEYLFLHEGLKVPFPALSDGYRAYLEKLHQAASMEEQAVARSLVDACRRPEMAHANCCRSFIRLYEQSPMEARALYIAVQSLVSSAS